MDLKTHMTAYPVLWAALAGSLALLAGAHAFENFGGLQPCPLCLRQREAHWVAAAVSAGAIAVTWRPTPQQWRQALLALLAVVYVVSAGVAFYHVGVEQKWWDAPASCAANAPGTISLTDMLERLQQPAAAPTCADIPWSFLGLSMAAYNVIFSLGLAALVAWPLRTALGHLRSAKGATSA